MKKLNRKGFTLIELLAVIVILAIVVVVTIPSVISSINKAKANSLVNATATVTEWFTKQYELSTLGSVVGSGDLSSTFTSFGLNKDNPTSLAGTDGKSTILKEAGITNTTGLSGTAQLKGTKVCIILTADDTSQFYVTENQDAKDAGVEYIANGDKAKLMKVTGSGC